MPRLKGTAALIIAMATVAILLIAWPAYRLFFLISLGIGVGVAAGLYLWHRWKPVKEEAVDNHKRPLGL